MTGWIILGVIVGILLLINLLPVGAYCRYDGETLIQLCIGPVRIQLVPQKAKSRKQQEKADAKKAKKKAAKAQKKKDKKETSLVQKKPKKKKAQKKPETQKSDAPKQPLTDKIAGLIPFVKLVTEFLGKFRGKFLIKKLYVHMRLAGDDPAKLGVNTGRAWAAIATAMPILKSRFRIRSSDVQVTPDFTGTKTNVEAVLHIRLIVGAVILLAIRYGIKALKLYLQRKKQQKIKKAVQQ